MNKTIYLLLILLVQSCASGHRKEQKQFRNLYSKKQYDELLKLIKKGELKKDKDSKLLYQMELGSIYFGKEQYEKAISELLKAKDLTDKYFTKSVLNSVATSTILSDNFEKFRGAFYEKSLVHYLLVASYFNIYKRGSVYKKDKLSKLNKKQTQDYLFKARAEVLAWDGFFEEIKTTYKKKTTYHYDLLVKLYGGLIHEEIGKRNELNIALILYQDAHKILNTLYPAFETYNEKSKEYFELATKKKIKLSDRPLVKKFKETSNYNQLSNYIKYKILNVAYKYNKSKYRKLKKRFKISKELISEIESKGSPVNITINQGLIPEKTGKTINIGLIGMMDGIEDEGTRKLVKGIGIPILTAFAINELGLYPRHRYMHRGEFRAYNQLFHVTAKAMAIEYEIPVIEKFDNKTQYKLEFKQNKKTVKSISLSKIASLGDFAKLDLEDTSTPRILRKASRVAIKHIAAIASAFATYNGMSKGKKSGRSMRRRRGRGGYTYVESGYSSSGGGDAFAKIAAVAQYALLAKAIEKSEKADTRFWSTLPKNVLQVETKLKSGLYDLVITSDKKKSYQLGQVTVEGKKNNFTYHRPDIK